MAQAVPETASAGAMPPAAAHVEVVLVDSGGPTSASCHQLGDEQQPQQQQQQNPQQPTPDREPASAPPPPPPPPPAERLHHLTRHVLPEESRGGAAVAALGAPDPRAAELLVRSMGQRDLRRNFQLVYGSPTSSFNNAWLRRKLCEGGRRSCRLCSSASRAALPLMHAAPAAPCAAPPADR
jgi:hypothetical protein